MKIAVVASGWHFPLHFFEAIAKQQIPEGSTVDMFCVSHRDPKFSAEEKKHILPKLGWSYREMMDRILYAKIASVEEIEALGWNYILEPNTIGDMGNVNQWLEKHNYKDYDVMLISHDDNLILNDQLYVDLLSGNPDWLILTNSKGSPMSIRDSIKYRNRPISIRGSFEFFKTEVFDLIGGKFDLSTVTLTREGETEASTDLALLKDWNNTTRPLRDAFEKKGLGHKIVPISDTYRISKYCIEGERGFISFVQEAYKKNEDKGLAKLQEYFENTLGKRFDLDE